MLAEILFALLALGIFRICSDVFMFWRSKLGIWKKTSQAPRQLPPVSKVVLQFSHDGELPTEYAPLLSLRKAKVKKENIVPDIVDELESKLTLTLIPKTHELPFSKRENRPPFVAIAKDGSTMEITARAGAAFHDNSTSISKFQSVVESVNIALKPSLELQNVAPTLINLQKLINDSFIGGITNFLISTMGLYWLVYVGMFLEVLIEYNLYILEWLCPIWLSDATAYPVARGKEGHHQLEFFFSGHVRLLRFIPVPFVVVHLPHFVIPGLHAELHDLITEQPLATAELVHERFPKIPLGLAATGLFSSFKSKIFFRGVLPRIAIEENHVDGSVTRQELGLAADSLVSLNMSLEGTVSKNTVQIDLQSVQVSQDDKVLAEVTGSMVLSTSSVTTPSRHGKKPMGVMEILLHSADEERLVSPLDLEIRAAVQAQGLNLDVESHQMHPFFKGKTDVFLVVKNANASGNIEVTTTLTDRKRDLMVLPTADLTFSGTIQTTTTPDGNSSKLYDGTSLVHPHLSHLEFAGNVTGNPQNGLEISVSSDGAYALFGTTDLPEIPEVGFEQDMMAHWSLEGDLALEGCAKLKTEEKKASLAQMDFTGTCGQATIRTSKCTFGTRAFLIPKGLTVHAVISNSTIVAGGLGHTHFLASWDFNDESPVLIDSKKAMSVELLVPELLDGGIKCHVGPEGSFELLGQCVPRRFFGVVSEEEYMRKKDIYDWRFLNALLNPGVEDTRLYKILDAVPLTDKLIVLAEMFSKDLHTLVTQAVKYWKKLRAILKEMNVVEPKEIVPGREMARLIVKLLYGNEIHTDRMYKIVKQATDANGLNIREVKVILSESLPALDEYPYEVDRILRWLNNILTPTPPMAEIHPISVLYDPPLSQLPKYSEMLKDIPSATEIYNAVDSKNSFDSGFAEKLSSVAPFLTLKQIEYVLSKQRLDWPEFLTRRLRYIYELKKRTHMIMYTYGGPEYLPQSVFISMYLGEACYLSAQCGASTAQSKVESLMGESLLGPLDVAVLLNACLGSLDQGQVNATNTRLLLNLLDKQPGFFLRGVLMEMANAKHRVVATSIIAVMEMDQSLAKVAFDVVRLFEDKLGVRMPRRKDYMAGGRWANESYYEAMQQAAKLVYADSEPYLAFKHHIETAYHASGDSCADLTVGSKNSIASMLHLPLKVSEEVASCMLAEDIPLTEHQLLVKKLSLEAQQAVELADKEGAACVFTAKLSNDKLEHHRLVTAHYLAAFEACRKLLASERVAFHQPWLRSFMGRNFEALTVLSVVQNVKDDIDKVRLWLAAQAGGFQYTGPNSADDQTLLDKVIDALYYYKDDQELLRKDPLVRLLIPEPPGQYLFSIVSCMGVVTDGAKGTELDTAVARLREQRGVQFVRADTATVRTPDYNAMKAEEAIRSITTPFGWIGYSQGSANAFLTEGNLMGGTPEQQRLIKNLVTRMILFNASNGSCHGTCGNWKIDRAFREGEMILKPYQGIVSQEVVNQFLKVAAAIMRSRESVRIATGFQSLSYSGCKPIFQNRQFKADSPTCSMKGIIEEVNLPEALHLLSNALTKQMERDSSDPQHDTQVTLADSTAHPIWVKNDNTKVLEHCDIGTITQRTSHWSPLVQATAHITTPSDIERSVYDSPKDRHLFPWVELNARFGFIQTIS